MLRFATVAGLVALLFPPLIFPQASEKSITTEPGEVGALLRQWWKEGTAAGNSGDTYDNRDAGHSDLDMALFPQLGRIVYTPDDVKKRRHWAAPVVVRPGVVFGNSSTSAPPTAGGSNPRMYYTQPAGLSFLYRQYIGNNLYIFPEHRDHDPGHNGPDEGFGDLYPTNTPYLLISQGSSGSDQPFMRAVAFTLAAFRPEVKKKLAAAGLLMPTVQMLLRSTNGQLHDPDDYLTPRAHPTVFEGSWVNDLGLVRAAHALQVNNLPPMVQLKVLEEGQQVRGKDFFDVAGTEKLADTPAAIARIFRGKDYRRRLVVSAEKSFDLHRKPLTFTWVVLRGDKDKIQIIPRGQDRASAEIVVAYHERRPIAAGAALESNRVDIGVFAHNGTYFSAPAFLTFYALDNEARTYDYQGRIQEIGYGMGETRVTVANWPAFFAAVTKEPPDAHYFPLPEDARGQFLAALPRFNELQKKGTAQEMQDFLDQQGPKRSLRATADELLRRAMEDIGLVPRFWNEETKGQYPISAVLKRLGHMGLLASGPGRPPAYKFLGTVPTVYEKTLIERANAVFLKEWLLPRMLTASTSTNYVDPRIATPKLWRDVYRYDDRGNYLGWTRYDGEQTLEFTADGLLTVDRDELGRCRHARLVDYVQAPRPTPGVNDQPLRMVPSGHIFTYGYARAEDRKGKIVAENKVPDAK